MEELAIEIRNLCKSIGGREILKNINFIIREGEEACIIGQSGHGKTAIARTLMRIEPFFPPDIGEIYVRGKNIVSSNDRQFEDEFLKSRILGYVFQGNALFMDLNVCDNVALFLREVHDVKGNELEERVNKSLEEVELDGSLWSRNINGLSGSEKKKVAIARAIALNNEIIIYDEPTTGMSPEDLWIITRLIKKIHKDTHNTSVVISHDLDSVGELTHRSYDPLLKREVSGKVIMVRKDREYLPGKIYFDGSYEEFASSNDENILRFRERVEKYKAKLSIALNIPKSI